jgi:hypothetical protein
VRHCVSNDKKGIFALFFFFFFFFFLQMGRNWITFYDTSPEGRVIYTSDSVTDHTLFEPNELVGRTAYSIFHPGDQANVKNAHVQNVYNERMSSMIAYRHLCRNGEYIQIESLVICSYDFIVTCNFILEEDSTEHKMRVSAADEWYVCIHNGPLQKVSTWKVHKKLNITRDELWKDDQVVRTLEKRVCLILNRFTDSLEIVYASSLAYEVLGLDHVKCLGNSIYDYLPEIDCMSLQTHMNLSKRHDMMFRLRFDWNVNGEKGVSEQVEGVVSCTDDGLVMVLRLAPRTILRF